MKTSERRKQEIKEGTYRAIDPTLTEIRRKLPGKISVVKKKEDAKYACRGRHEKY